MGKENLWQPGYTQIREGVIIFIIPNHCAIRKIMAKYLLIPFLFLIFAHVPQRTGAQAVKEAFDVEVVSTPDTVAVLYIIHSGNDQTIQLFTPCDVKQVQVAIAEFFAAILRVPEPVICPEKPRKFKTKQI